MPRRVVLTFDLFELILSVKLICPFFLKVEMTEIKYDEKTVNTQYMGSIYY